MNDDKLVACLAKYADSQETIQAVRKAIVGLAVAGRLDDRSASQFADTLGEFIGGSGHPSHTTGAKAKGLESKFETTDLPHPSLTPDRFVRLGDIAKIEKGKTGIKQARSGPYPLVVTASDRGSCDHYDFDGAAAIVPLVSSTGHGKASLHRLHYQEGKFALGSILAAAFPKSPERISARFLFEYLSAFKEELLVSQMIGTANVSLTVKKISEVPVPIVSRMAQRTVDELMALCDTLEAEREKREATRDRLTTASLSRLTAPNVDEKQFKAHADFAIRVLPELTTRPDQIKVLRQTILDLAVRGKLVEQDPNDEPASDLLNSIAVRISDLVSKGELKRPQSVSPLPASMDCVGLPPGWALARFGDIASIETNLVDPKAYKSMPHIAPDNIEGWTGRLLPYISVAKSGVFSGKHLFDPGVLLYSKIRPNLAKVTKVDFRGLCSADMYPILPFISRDYLLIFMITQAFVDQAVTEANRVAMPKINQAALSNIIVSVPPLAEQGRIVAKANELLAKCGELERELSSGRATTSRLLHALLIAALRPVALEAA